MACVLVVDDSSVDRRIVGGLLEAAGYSEIEFAADGVEAIERMRARPPSIIITDLNMPNLDGLKLVEHVARDFSQDRKSTRLNSSHT